MVNQQTISDRPHCCLSHTIHIPAVGKKWEATPCGESSQMETVSNRLNISPEVNFSDCYKPLGWQHCLCWHTQANTVVFAVYCAGFDGWQLCVLSVCCLCLYAICSFTFAWCLTMCSLEMTSIAITGHSLEYSKQK